MKVKYPRLTVDVVILYRNKFVFIKRGNEPYRGRYALPGGFVEAGERVEEAAIREAREETGLDIRLIKLLGVYSDPDRDPRGHVVSICYLAEGTGELKPSTDACEVLTCSLDAAMKLNLAFDHDKILRDAIAELRRIGKYF
ncbi:MAG: NUDIX hydrolase [Methanocellales archaeon]